MNNLFYLLLVSATLMFASCQTVSEEREFVNELIDELKSPDPTNFVKKYFPSEEEFKEFYSGNKSISTDTKTGRVVDMIDEKWEGYRKDRHTLFALLMKQTVEWDKVEVDSLDIQYRFYNKRPTNMYQHGKSMSFIMTLIYHRKEIDCKVSLFGIRTKNGDFKIYSSNAHSCNEPY